MNHLMQAAVSSADDSGFSIGMLLMYIGGALLLAFFCSLGFIARIRENRLEERRAVAARRRAEARSDSADVTDQLPDTEGHHHGERPADEDAQHRPGSV